jgi:hypothetical protein
MLKVLSKCMVFLSMFLRYLLSIVEDHMTLDMNVHENL